MSRFTDLTPKERRRLLKELREINEKLENLDAMLDFILRARKIKQPQKGGKR